MSGDYSQKVFAQKIATVLSDLISNKAPSLGQEHLREIAESCFEKHRKLNRIRRARTEMGFIIRNFFQFLLDGKYRFRDRITLLVKGLQRYVTYFLPRIKKTH